MLDKWSQIWRKPTSALQKECFDITKFDKKSHDSYDAAE